MDGCSYEGPEHDDGFAIDGDRNGMAELREEAMIVERTEASLQTTAAVKLASV